MYRRRVYFCFVGKQEGRETSSQWIDRTEADANERLSDDYEAV